MRSPHLSIRWALLLTCGLLTLADLPWVSLSTPVAVARSTGGRSGGGSFRRQPPPTRSAPPPTRSAPPPSRSVPPPPNYGGGPVFIPVPVPERRPSYPVNQGPVNQGSSTTSGGLQSQSGSPVNAVLTTLVVLLLGGVSLGVILWFLLRRQQGADPLTELENDTVTLSKIQVALVAQAAPLQQSLSELTRTTDTNAADSLLHLLQEAALILLRHSESWTHAHVESQTVPNLEIAQKVFNQMAIAQRSKLSAETLVNVGGRLKEAAQAMVNSDEGPAAYIVVTLLVGTAHDQPLCQSVRTHQELQDVLEKVAALPSEYLSVLELIWSPQDSSDSLTDDELLTEYNELIPI